jgi:signal transduction histidine kinase/ABC-type branched-subunit amino acid transport system ATPase component
VLRTGLSDEQRRVATTPLLEVTGLTKRFGAVTVLRDVTLHVRRGEVVALVGETGAGKSSVVSCLARILEPDAGDIRFESARMPATPRGVRLAGIEVLWQDHGLCDDLDVAANITLGREARVLFAEGDGREAAAAVLRRVGAQHVPLDRSARALSRGQKQLVALGRALLPDPKLLVLDEPTASLGVLETARVQRLIAEMRDKGAGVLLVTHDLEQVFTLADRIVVLRQGRVVADVSPMEVQRADVVALMSGMETDSMAQRQLQRLRSLVDQLSDVEPAASLPLIVSAMAAALDQDMLCVHLLDPAGEEPGLRRSAAVGLPAPLLEVNELLDIGAEGGVAGLAAELAEVVVIDDLATHPVPDAYRDAAARSNIHSEWAAPVVGARGVLGTVTGYGTSVGRPDSERLELARLYLGYAAAAIERERLLAEVWRRNRILEAVRGMLETIAGPDRVHGGMEASLEAVRRGLGALAVGALVEEGGSLAFHAASDGDLPVSVASRLRTAACEVLDAHPEAVARLLDDDLAGVALRLPHGAAALVAHLPGDPSPARDTLDLLDDASRSLALALEAEALEGARREAAALRRSRVIQRELLSSLSHELRTPLTAIQGYASTLCQPDLTWDAESTERFLRSIAAESARMERLVGDLLDSTAIDSGSLRLQPDWCDLRLVLEAALRCVHDAEAVRAEVDDGLDPVWGDHDRLEQVLVNLLENALAHGASDAGVDVVLRAGAGAGTVELVVRDHGQGISPHVAGRIFESRVRGGTDGAGAGLGLAIAKGIVDAHGGRLEARSEGDGTTFTVTLPTEPPEVEDGAGSAAWTVLHEDGGRGVG